MESAEAPLPPLVEPLPARTADPATVAAGMRQLSTAPERPHPLINGDWTINQDNNDPAVAQFQRDLQNYKNQVAEFMAAKAQAEEAGSAPGTLEDATKEVVKESEM